MIVSFNTSLKEIDSLLRFIDERVEEEEGKGRRLKGFNTAVCNRESIYSTETYTHIMDDDGA